MEFGPIASWVAVAPAAISAIVAIYQARKSRKSAHDATEALGAALRPIFAFGWRGNHQGSITIEATNMAAFDAVDIELWVSVDEKGVLGKNSTPRLRGHVPGTLNGGETLNISDVMQFADVGVERVFVVTARFSDERSIQRWEQRGRVTVGTVAGSRPPRIEARKYEQGMPVKYKK
jgi:hypothetical protein